jgi:hypothetical protein
MYRAPAFRTGRAVGARVVRWRRTTTPLRCDCCSCPVAAFELVADVEHSSDNWSTVCQMCADPPPAFLRPRRRL